MKKMVLFLLAICTFVLAYAQNDSLPYGSAFKLNEGIYFSFADFKKNNVLPAERIMTELDKTSIDFFTSLVEKKTILYKDSASAEKRISTDHLWGYCQNGNVYYRIKTDFIKIPILGRLSHFVHYSVTSGSDNYYAPFYYNNANFETTVIDEYIIDGANGTLYDFTVKNMEKLLQDEPALLTEFSQLKGKKKKDLKFLFIRRYNEKHPLYFIKLN
jgi:hypothetical protein